MDRINHKQSRQALRRLRVRSKVIGTPKRPRLSVKISNLHVTAQIIDDSTHSTIAYASSVGQKGMPGNLTQRAKLVGAAIAKKAAVAKVKRVVLDRGSRLYHGRIKALADTARESGLEF